MLGIEHERIHLETSSVLIRQLPIRFVRDHPMWPVCPTHAAGVTADNALLPVPARTVDIGKKTGHRLYGWDNEYGSHSVDVPAFQASQLLVSNEEYLEFVKAGGYDQSEFWTDEGWRWRNYRKAKCPVFWVAQPDHPTEPYRFRNMTNEQAMPWNWPAEVNQLEAKAFCNWRSARTGISIRLPTEEEWASLRLHTLPEDVDIDTWAVVCRALGDVCLACVWELCNCVVLMWSAAHLDCTGAG
jgi:formylglycine-generating enzyme required for sulfatase activity